MINLNQNLFYMQQGTLNSVDASSFAYITPDDLMLYCQSRLQGIDTQVQSAFAKQEMGNSDAAKLSTLQGSDALSAPSDKLDLNTAAGYQKAWDAWQKMLATVSTLEDPATKQALQDAADQLGAKLTEAYNQLTGGSTFAPDFASDQNIQDFFNNGKFQNANGATFNKTGSTSDTIETSDWQSLVTDAVKNVQQNLSSNAELSMINLQSLMSQRQEAIQICTNLVQSLGDQVNKIADNVGK